MRAVRKTMSATGVARSQQRRSCSLKRGELLHRAIERAVQVGGELRAHRRAYFLFGIGPERQGALEQRAADGRRDKLVPALVARVGALDQAVVEQRLQVAAQG